MLVADREDPVLAAARSLPRPNPRARVARTIGKGFLQYAAGNLHDHRGLRLRLGTAGDEELAEIAESPYSSMMPGVESTVSMRRSAAEARASGSVTWSSYSTSMVRVVFAIGFLCMGIVDRLHASRSTRCASCPVSQLKPHDASCLSISLKSFLNRGTRHAAEAVCSPGNVNCFVDCHGVSSSSGSGTL